MNNSKVWRLMEPSGTGYAQCALGSPVKITHKPCSQCTIGDSYVVPKPLVFEWEPGSDQIGDFVWPSGTRVAVQERVFKSLAKVPDIEPSNVEMFQDPKLKRPKNPRRAKPRVWLPYEGPPLVELIVNHYVHVLPETTTEVVERCATCGRENRHLTGGESKQRRWSPEKEDLVPNPKPRVPGQGIFASKTDVKSVDIFRTYEFPGFILCTDEVKALLEGAQFTNLDFLEYGDIV